VFGRVAWSLRSALITGTVLDLFFGKCTYGMPVTRCEQLKNLKTDVLDFFDTEQMYL